MNLQPYLIFPGTCRAALQFYAEALGGSIEHLQTVADSPLPAPPEHAGRVFHSSFAADGLRFKASDGEPGKDPAVGENFAMFITCPDAARQRQVFSALAEEGKVLFPLADGFGMVEDRFRIRWMVAAGAN